MSSVRKVKPQLSVEDVSEVIAHAYDAALKPELWQDALERLGNMLGGTTFGMSVLHRAQGIKLAVATMDPAGFQVIKERFNDAKTNVFVAAQPSLPIAVPVRRQDVQGDSAYFGGGLYNEAFRHQGLAHRAIACLHRSDALACPMGIFAPTRAGDLSAEDLRLLDLVLPHFGRALQLSLRIGSLEDSARLTKYALDRLPIGVLVVDGGLKVTQLNEVAESAVAAQDGLRLSCGRLEAWQHEDTLAIAKALAGALAGGAGAAAVSVRRPGAARPYVLLIAPLGPQSSAELGRSAGGAIVLVSDPGRPSDARLLRELFGLTPREAELVGALLDGMRLNEYADERGVSINTVKSQLRAVFAKTNTTRQGELIGVLKEIQRIA
jgi:DNA-binding CsgD family transcriptional regulator